MARGFPGARPREALRPSSLLGLGRQLGKETPEQWTPSRVILHRVSLRTSPFFILYAVWSLEGRVWCRQANVDTEVAA
jgi:hypothetical protein